MLYYFYIVKHVTLPLCYVGSTTSNAQVLDYKRNYNSHDFLTMDIIKEMECTKEEARIEEDRLIQEHVTIPKETT